MLMPANHTRSSLTMTTSACAGTATTTHTAATANATAASNNNIHQLDQAEAAAFSLADGQAGNNGRTMQSDEDFNIRFVNLVRLHRCLYDKKVPEYRNRDNQEKSWLLISQDTCESVLHCKERWRNLRACLSRYIKQQSGAEPQHKPYYLTEHMAFLLPFLKSTRNAYDGSGGGGSSVAAIHAATMAAAHGKTDLAATLLQQQQQHLLGGAGAVVGGLPAAAAAMQQLHHILPPTLQHSALGRFAGGSVDEVKQLPVVLPLHNGAADDDDGGAQLLVKHSLSENEDEETIDAFDPAVQQHHHQAELNNHHHLQSRSAGDGGACSPTLSDTASASSLQNHLLIPDVQLGELHSPEPPDSSAMGGGGGGGRGGGAGLAAYLMQRETALEYNGAALSEAAGAAPPKRIKTECDGGLPAASMYAGSCAGGGGGGMGGGGGGPSLNHDCADMEFFRSILPDLDALTAQQKRKLKIGILELIDDVVERYPAHSAHSAGSGSVSLAASAAAASTLTNGGAMVLLPEAGGLGPRPQWRSSAREWRK